MNILVVGATGSLGRNVLPRLLERGHRVRAVVQRRDQAPLLERMGIEAVPGTLLDEKAMEAAARGVHAGLQLGPGRPAGTVSDRSLSDRWWLEGTRNLLDALARNGARRYVQQSFALVYGERGAEPADESAPLQVQPINESAIEVEELVRGSDLDWTLLRGGLFYGPGTGREEGWWQAARQGRLRIPGDGQDLVSLIHIVDMARAVVAAVERGAASTAYNIVDDEPVRVGDLFRYLAAQVGLSELQTGGPRFLPSLGVRNLRAQIQLGWRPVFPNYQAGLAYAGFGEAFQAGTRRATATRGMEQIQTEAIL